MINSAEVIAAVAIFVLGLLCIIINRNMIKTFIGIEILNRGVTLLIISSGFYRGQGAFCLLYTSEAETVSYRPHLCSIA